MRCPFHVADAAKDTPGVVLITDCQSTVWQLKRRQRRVIWRIIDTGVVVLLIPPMYVCLQKARIPQREKL